MLKGCMEVLVDGEVLIVQDHGLSTGRVTPDIGECLVWLSKRFVVESISDDIAAQRIIRFS
jgi:hypothetical protein